ncbi:hypothetical protein [Burkholderia pseudomallei]|uniref:hypothetical protein n=1 Tax=Burkholderia pseudomallei TaxID=28450 RepID=UPI000A1A2DF3|nr:hypothetical protein [Burkholderia pseudomallei]ARL03132.1 hypothetical protein BOC44_16540 [Burkholderia pseudomallei]ARL10616.1 hypothetical protein BOC45_19010 [Burkholderia pseudomallei]ARL15313.1 hypothetical protein BOC46_07030 [Burkholderia pseudomallei]OSP93770.1 hypothetical protein BOC41_14305 [Burkholderia pseudomallei]TXD01013.1 hypothetical protein FTI75_30105 [Burkholderia pseudomallei]
MKHITLSAFVAGVCAIAAANAATTIPAPFQGNWASNCKQAKNPQDTEGAMSTVRIDTTSVSYGEAQCTLVKVSGNDASHLDGAFDCLGDGVGGNEALSLRLAGGKLRLIDRAGNIWQSTDELSRCL